MASISDIVKRPKYYLILLYGRLIPKTLKWDEKYLKILFKYKTGRALDFENPESYSEKLQWLKLYDRNPLYSKMVDKYEAKNYVSKLIGEKYIIPTYGIYNDFNDINFDDLPCEFIIKCTHNSGGYVICDDKKKLDISLARKKINSFLSQNYYYSGREWPYKDVNPRIIIEKLLKNNDSSDLIEYNFFCFNGTPELVMTCYGDKRQKRYNDFYDMNFNKINLECIYSNSNIDMKKPEQFEEMINISKKLSSGIPQLRVDLYICNEKVYVGELTFFHWGGFPIFNPIGWDYKLGKLISINKKKK